MKFPEDVYNECQWWVNLSEYGWNNPTFLIFESKYSCPGQNKHLFHLLFIFYNACLSHIFSQFLLDAPIWKHCDCHSIFFICIEELEDNKHCWPGKWEKDQRRWWKVSCGLLVTNIRFLLCFCWHLWFFCVAEITVLSFRLNNQHRSLTEIRRPPSLLLWLAFGITFWPLEFYEFTISQTH